MFRRMRARRARSALAPSPRRRAARGRTAPVPARRRATRRALSPVLGSERRARTVAGASRVAALARSEADAARPPRQTDGCDAITPRRRAGGGVLYTAGASSCAFRASLRPRCRRPPRPARRTRATRRLAVTLHCSRRDASRRFGRPPQLQLSARGATDKRTPAPAARSRPYDAQHGALYTPATNRPRARLAAHAARVCSARLLFPPRARRRREPGDALSTVA
jgi:hypothetical protein